MESTPLQRHVCEGTDDDFEAHVRDLGRLERYLADNGISPSYVQHPECFELALFYRRFAVAEAAISILNDDFGLNLDSADAVDFDCTDEVDFFWRLTLTGDLAFMRRMYL